MGNNAEPECMAFMANDEVRRVSSSGGVFTLAAEYILDRGGVVTGAIYDDDFSVKLGMITDKGELGKMRGSKYIQAKAGLIYREVRSLLEDGRTVLFTGLPCHVAGLYGVLGKRDYPNLYTIDLVCHGMTSRKVFDKYRRDVLRGRQLTDLRFKAKEPWGWHAGVNASFADGSVYAEPLERDPYFRAYLKNISKNTACSVCKLNQFPRRADLSTGDFWGINNFDRSYNDGLGTSEVFVNNDHGRELLDAIRPKAKLCAPVPLKIAMDGNGVLRAAEPLNFSRDYFFQHLMEVDFGELTVKCENLEADRKKAEEEQKAERGRLYANPDFIKIRMLATLLRDYGVKHIVLSPGGRDVPIVRMFEYNANQFVLHSVTDERSAAYYGLGLAAQLKSPVACVCTSGTAASNYLPAVTEAYYTGIPLIMITADRYAVFHEQGEDQTIPQSDIYHDVIKKSITLTETTGYKNEYQTRRDISDCILEATHHVWGPVHINVPVDNIVIGAKVPRKDWALLPKVYPHILRVGADDSHNEIMRWVDSLKKSQRILLVYGQNPPLTETQEKKIEEFASKYNCVIVTDFISNLDCAYSLKPYNLLRMISQKEFNEQLAPDILITVGGKRLMNDPLTFKVRGGPGNIRHWSVIPNGKVKDFYFRLSSILEMSQEFFFDFFAKNAGDSTNNLVYYDKWIQLNKKYGPNEIKGFNAHYVQSRFFPRLPTGSMMHLGVGQTFLDSRRYTVTKGVEFFCNMGTNGIDGSTSTFLGQCAVAGDKLCFLMVGDLSFFYDMNSIWNKKLGPNVRILMVNNSGTDLLRGHGLKYITSEHHTQAKGWVEACGFRYLSAASPTEFDTMLEVFMKGDSIKPVFFEVFCD